MSILELKYKKFKRNKIYGHILCVSADPKSRKRARDDERYNHMFGGAGVYLYVTEKKKGVKRPQIYAGKATHLDARANDHSRLKSKDLLFLIKRGDAGESKHMDENWRQQIEHKLIDELMKNQLQRGYDCLNKSYESKSLMDEGERARVDSWFERLCKCLVDEFNLRFFKPHSSFGDQRDEKLHIAFHDGEKYVSKSKPGVFYGKDLIKIPKGSYCRPSLKEPKYKFPIDIRYQDFKWELIKSNILQWSEEHEYYEFTQDMWFTSLTQMAAIVYNTQPGAKIWIARKPSDSEGKWSSMKEHPIWKSKN